MDATKEKNRLALKVSLLEAKLAEFKENKKATSEAIVEACGKETCKNKTYASNLTTKRQNASKQAQLKSPQENICFLAEQNALRRFPVPNVGAQMPERGFNMLMLMPFTEPEYSKPI